MYIPICQNFLAPTLGFGKLFLKSYAASLVMPIQSHCVMHGHINQKPKNEQTNPF
jgi:hypothetical protein